MAYTTTTTTTTETVIKQKATKAEPQFPDINTLRQAIPKHCFEPPALRSLWYLLRDVVTIAGLGWAAVTYIPTIENTPLRVSAWIVYGYVQGLIGVGLWILGHEAGHGAFSKHQRLNDVVGLFSHSALCVPFYSWKFSHHRHHKYTGHMEKDMAFVPATRADYIRKTSSQMMEYLEDTPIYNFVTLMFHQVFAWLTYLMFNISSGKDSTQKKAGLFGQSHFDPTSAVFRKSEAPFIVISDLGLATTFGCLYYLSGIVGTQNTILLYAQPYFWVHHWLIAITYLHHTHKEVPHYEAENWTFVKGALATVDRDFGFVGRHLFHGIIEHHVIHHLFPRIPFYYAEEATEAIKPILGDLYTRDDRSFLGQLWTNFTQCKYVEADEAMPGVLHWAKPKAKTQ